jgi:hypothetical protein
MPPSLINVMRQQGVDPTLQYLLKIITKSPICDIGFRASFQRPAYMVPCMIVSQRHRAWCAPGENRLSIAEMAGPMIKNYVLYK